MKLPGVANDVQTILLDIDGTLVDSNDAHAQSWVAALGEIGIAARYDFIRPLIGMGGDQMLPPCARRSIAG